MDPKTMSKLIFNYGSRKVIIVTICPKKKIVIIAADFMEFFKLFEYFTNRAIVL